MVFNAELFSSSSDFRFYSSHAYFPVGSIYNFFQFSLRALFSWFLSDFNYLYGSWSKIFIYWLKSKKIYLLLVFFCITHSHCSFDFASNLSQWIFSGFIVSPSAAIIDKTIGWTEIHLLFAVICKVSGDEGSNPFKKGSILPRKALLGIWIFIAIYYQESRYIVKLPGIPVK